MREYAVKYTTSKGKDKVLCFDAESLDEAIEMAKEEAGVKSFASAKLYDITDADASVNNYNPGLLVFADGEAKNVHVVDDVMLTKHGDGDNLQYVADGKTFEVDGEFYVDKEGRLHHTHLFEDGEEFEIIIPYENGSHKL